MRVKPDEYVLDAVERAWAFHDRTICFRHACHHSTCGACGMRVNGVEKLSCITLLRDVVHDGGTLKVEPLRNFPVVSDLAVDMGHFYRKMERLSARPIVPVTEAEIENPPPNGNPTVRTLRLFVSAIASNAGCVSAPARLWRPRPNIWVPLR